MSYDHKCEDLARAFLLDLPDHTEADVRQLSQDIQNAIEDWWSEMREKRNEHGE